jgi:predicted ATPase
MGAELLLPHFLSFLAKAYGKAGGAEKGLALLAEALALVDKNGECCWEAELNRIKGELLLKHDGAEARFRGAESCFQDALTIARRQSTRSWELRAATSLSRLWHREGRKEEAWKLLHGVYGGFTEGFGTADLEEARALLDALA